MIYFLENINAETNSGILQPKVKTCQISGCCNAYCPGFCGDNYKYRT